MAEVDSQQKHKTKQQQSACMHEGLVIGELNPMVEYRVMRATPCSQALWVTPRHLSELVDGELEPKCCLSVHTVNTETNCCEEAW